MSRDLPKKILGVTGNLENPEPLTDLKPNRTDDANMKAIKLTSIPIETQIAEIMDEFDFQKVRRVMEFLEWVWVPICRVPTIDDVRDSARRLLQELGERDRAVYISSGGLWARRDKWGLLSLQFTVSDWEVSDESLES